MQADVHAVVPGHDRALELVEELLGVRVRETEELLAVGAPVGARRLELHVPGCLVEADPARGRVLHLLVELLPRASPDLGRLLRVLEIRHGDRERLEVVAPRGREGEEREPVELDRLEHLLLDRLELLRRLTVVLDLEGDRVLLELEPCLLVEANLGVVLPGEDPLVRYFPRAELHVDLAVPERRARAHDDGALAEEEDIGGRPVRRVRGLSLERKGGPAVGLDLAREVVGDQLEELVPR